jgi:hypothetical protein
MTTNTTDDTQAKLAAVKGVVEALAPLPKEDREIVVRAAMVFFGVSPLLHSGPIPRGDILGIARG